MELRRVIGVPTAAGVGVAAMLGAGVFAVWAPAAALAGAGLLAALALALLVAALNAASTTRLALAHPESGGVFAFARALGSPHLAFAAGVLFLVGKVASAAAIARVAADHLAPGVPFVAPVLLVALAAVNASGVRATAVVSLVTAVVVVAAIVAVDVLGAAATTHPEPLVWPDAPAGLLPAATLIFFAFAGYARVTTLGGEVRDPRRVLPVAVGVSVLVVAVVAAATAVVLLRGLGAARLAASTAPLVELLGDAFRPLVTTVVVIACVGSCLGVLAGLSRTALAMARAGELPAALGRIHPRTAAPVRAELVIAVVAAVATVAPAALLIGASAGAVLGYYAVAHLLAARGGGVGRVVAVLGGAGCVLLAAFAPPLALAGAACVLVAGFGIRALVAARRRA